MEDLCPNCFSEAFECECQPQNIAISSRLEHLNESLSFLADRLGTLMTTLQNFTEDEAA